MKLVRIRTMRLVQMEKQNPKILNSEKMVQNICLLDSQILMYKNFGRGQHEAE
jgi:hypothetical protein